MASEPQKAEFHAVASSWRQEFVARGDEGGKRIELAHRWQQYEHQKAEFHVVASSRRQEFVARGDEDRERTKLAGRWQQYSQTANLPRAATLGAVNNPNSKKTLAAFGGTEGQYHGR